MKEQIWIITSLQNVIQCVEILILGQALIPGYMTSISSLILQRRWCYETLMKAIDNISCI